MAALEQEHENALQIVQKQIQFARDYSSQLVGSVETADWFRIPTGSVSNIAWQVGHLAMAQYGLTLLRIRGKEPSDAEFITNAFMRCFKKGSTPQEDPSAYPSCEEIQQVFDAVHERAMSEIAGYTFEQLSESLPAPTAMYDTKLGSLFFCPMHEMLHAGQIGTIRRGLGLKPIR
ncbi:MAG: DinB family protein [Planctomycetota bacterium]